MSSASFDRLLADAASWCTKRASEDADIFADILPDVLSVDSADCALPAWDGPVPPLPKPMEVAKRSAAASSSAATPLPPPKLAKKSGRSGAPSVHDIASLNAALEQWAAILKEISGSCSMSMHVGPEPTVGDLEPYFAMKRAGTLSLHASAWRLFLRYAKVKSMDTHAVSESMVFEYVKHLNDTGAPPTRASAFLRACNFALGCCGFAVGDVIRISPRCRGASAMSLSRRLPRRQRDILLARWVIAAEAEVVLAAQEESTLTDQEASVLGFGLFCTHTRSRCSDAAKVTAEPQLDMCEVEDALNFAYIETQAAGSTMKTGNTPAKSNFSFPLVGLALGLSGQKWAEAWLAIRARIGHNADEDGCLQRQPLADGSFAGARIQAGQMTEWLRHLMERLGVERWSLRNVGSHSCKATLLSLAAKAGLGRETRRLLGGHSPPNDKSVEVYARDVLATPMQELGKIMRMVRDGSFDPDASRSGRWKLPPVAEVQDHEDPTCETCANPLIGQDSFQCACGSWFHSGTPCSAQCIVCLEEMCGWCDLSLSHCCADKTAAEASSDEEEDESDDSDCEGAAMAAEDAEDTIGRESSHTVDYLTKGSDGGSDAAFPEHGVVLHKFLGTCHRANEDLLPACGVRGQPMNYEVHTSPEAIMDQVLCWRPGCAPWAHR